MKKSRKKTLGEEDEEEQEAQREHTKCRGSYRRRQGSDNPATTAGLLACHDHHLRPWQHGGASATPSASRSGRHAQR